MGENQRPKPSRVESDVFKVCVESSRAEFDSGNSTFLKSFSDSFICLLALEVIIVS
jgi:hypothetical protein